MSQATEYSNMITKVKNIFRVCIKVFFVGFFIPVTTTSALLYVVYSFVGPERPEESLELYIVTVIVAGTTTVFVTSFKILLKELLLKKL